MSAAQKIEDPVEAAPARLIDRLLLEPQRFDLPTALRVAEQAGAPVEIVSDASTRLALASISGTEVRNGDFRIRSTVGGLVGALGALPPAYTQSVLEEQRRRSQSLVAFLDIFADRLTRFMVEAQEKYRLPRLLRWRGVNGGNRIVGSILALTGLRSDDLRSRNIVGDDVALRYAGFFAARTRNASALASLLGAHTGLPVAIEQFRSRWVSVPLAEQSALRPGAGPRLGLDAMAGAAVRDQAGSFRVVIGPVGYLDYLSLEPGSPRLADVMAITRLYAGAALRFDVQVVLLKEDVPFCRLGDPVHPPKLGWNAWARIGPLQADSRDAVVAAPG